MEHVTGYAQVEGACLYYEQAGVGEPVVLLHTGNGNTTIWDGQFEDLARDYQVIRFDFRGFGRSSYPPGRFLAARDLAGLLAHLGVDAAHIVGPSFGGRVAVEFALGYPARTRSLLLAAPVIREHAWSPDVVAARLAEEERFLAGDLDAAAEVMMRGWVAGPYRSLGQLDPGLLDRLRATQRASYLLRRASIETAGGEPAEEDLAGPAGDRLAEIDVPTLVLVGDRDHPDAVAIAERLAGGIHGARKLLIEGAGHMITMERPEDFLRIAREFLLAVTSR